MREDYENVPRAPARTRGFRGAQLEYTAPGRLRWRGVSCTTIMLAAGPGDPLYQFGSFIADPVIGRLYHGNDQVLLTPKSFLVLMVLVESRGRLVDKSELFRQVWPDTFVEPNNLARNISMIRKVLHEHDRDQEYIVTVSRHGYRFVAPVTQISRVDFAGD